jgi:hypothetical protein
MVENGNNNVTDLVEVTDSLEAIAVFRGWKNIFFTISLMCLLLIQGAFWVVDQGIRSVDQEILSRNSSGDSQEQVTAETPSSPSDPVNELQVGNQDANVPQDANTASTDSDQGQKKWGLYGFKLADVIRVCNGLLMLSTMLYCTTLLFSMIITVIGRLGGMRHICRAFFRSLIMLVLIVPWQQFLNSLFFGCIFSPDELSTPFVDKSADVVSMVLYYLRFPGYWLLVMFLLIASQARCARWGKSILRRLEII